MHLSSGNGDTIRALLTVFSPEPPRKYLLQCLPRPLFSPIPASDGLKMLRIVSDVCPNFESIIERVVRGVDASHGATEILMRLHACEQLGMLRKTGYWKPSVLEKILKLKGINGIIFDITILNNIIDFVFFFFTCISFIPGSSKAVRRLLRGQSTISIEWIRKKKRVKGITFQQTHWQMDLSNTVFNISRHPISQHGIHLPRNSTKQSHRSNVFNDFNRNLIENI